MILLIMKQILLKLIMPHQTNKVAQALIKEAITLYQNKQISLNTCRYLVGIAYSLKIHCLAAKFKSK